jgi:predicted transcriptional regulator
MENKHKQDWWDEISDEEKSDIEEGLAQADRREVVSHEEVMAKYKKYGRGRIEN